MLELHRDLALLGRILRDAGRVLVSTWPALLTVFLLGAATRAGFLWLAVIATRAHSFLGQAILPLAPVASLVALVVMLQLAGRRMPAFATSPGAAGLQVVAPLLIPFLAVYANQGLLRDDQTTYVHDILTDEQARAGLLSANWLRFQLFTGWRLLALVAAALVLRRVLQSPRLRSRWWVLPAVYVEAAWIVVLAWQFRSRLADAEAWLARRRAVVVALDAWDGVAASLGSVGHALHVALAWTWHNALVMVGLVVLPMAWLAIGQAVHRADAGAGDLASDRYGPLPLPQQVSRRLDAVPERVRNPAASALAPATDPLRELVAAVRGVASAGVAPMVVFCSLFVVAGHLDVAVAWLARWVIGPTSLDAYVALLPLVHVVERAVPMVVLVALVVAAVNTLQGQASEPHASAPEPQDAVIGNTA